MAPSGIPGLRGTDHVGFTVPDLEEAVTFFRDVIGCEIFYSLGAQEDSKGTRMRDKLGVDPRARIRDIRLVRCKNGANFEIFQYEADDQNKTQPRNSDIGGRHFAFYVDDIVSPRTTCAKRVCAFLANQSSRPKVLAAARTGSTSLRPGECKWN